MVDFYAIYTKVVDKVKTSYPNIYHADRFMPTVPKSPALFIREVARYERADAADFTRSDIQCNTVIEVQVMSNKATGSNAEVQAILALVNTAFREMYFRQTTMNVVDLNDKTGCRKAVRYARNLGDADTI